MLTSHKHKFVFVHVPKTGGTSVKRAWESHAELPTTIGLDEVEVTAGSKWVRPVYAGKAVYQHLSRMQICQRWPELSSYRFAGFVRNPWDWAVSNYEFVLKRAKLLPRLAVHCGSFESFISAWRLHKFQHPAGSQWHYLAAASGSLPTLVGRYEQLEPELADLTQTLGVTAKPLPHLKNNPHQPYTEYYTDKTRQLVAMMAAEDIKRFGYEFGG